ncbi:uncharacterized protein LOC115698322 [Cannabis sativa]|uniref:Uncharacterized protein n=2 Tax=Cannabis sativa TaxID=3483 RepID=A0AB40E9G0_CANSA|nr:uncharacterized protein LOC115698322 [Cannabis sativa]KAF4369773.1 hypothetical protein G4B88_022158 [Cannabis sativa]KAF4373018.1 hypothetical protein F8388_011045 [Cannabis sativa]KAF4377513.1 hypothetical protein F8388_025004 [Cannabis sativa]
MASMSSLQTIFQAKPRSFSSQYGVCSPSTASPAGSTALSWNLSEKNKKKTRPLTVVAAVGDVSADGTAYLIAGAAAVALLGTAFPILFSRKDTCPECDGAGFVRKSGVTLRANAARKDETQIVCARCNGLGKLNQIDKN